MMVYKGIEMKNTKPIIGVYVVGVFHILNALWVEANRLCVCRGGFALVFFLYETQYGLSLMSIKRWRRV